VPNFILNQQNPWAYPPPESVTETKDSPPTSNEPTGLASENTSHSVQNQSSITRSPQPQAEPQPLLSAFEAEMAKLLEEDAKEQPSEPADAADPSEPHTRPAETAEQTWPLNLVAGILQTVAGGIENLGSELKLKIPEVERHLANAQRNIPEDVGATMQTALSAVESQIQNLARVIQNASNASGEAAERVRQAELRSTEQVISGFGNMAHEFEEFGKTLFAAFEAEFGQRSDSNEGNAAEPTTVPNQDTNHTLSQTASNEEQISTEPLGQNIEKTTLSSEVDTSRDSPNKSPEAATVESPVPLYQHPPPPQPTSSLPSQTASKSITNNQQQTAGLHEPAKPLFSNWPNRPAFVSSSVLAATRPSGSSNAVSQQQVQTSEPSSTDRQPVSVPERVDTFHSSDSVTSLFMGNIGFQVTGRVIEEVFGSKGFSVQVHLPIDSSTGKHAGFGYARFQSASSAKAALDTLQGIIIDGHSLNLEYSDSSPIDGLQTQAPASHAARVPSDAPLNRALHHRHSWQPNTQQVREHRSSLTPSSSDNLPNSFSSNARSNLYRPTRPYSSHSLVEGATSQNHPEESPEFAARYPSLLPTFRSQEYPVAVPERSMTLSPNSEMARFPPVSQLDAHLLANQHRSGNRTDSEYHLPSSNRAPPVATVPAERASESPSSQQHREPRRTASTISPRPTRALNRDISNAHALRRRATEAMSLRHRAHENASRETRPSSLYEGRTRTLPGSFPVDDAPAPVPATNDDDESSDRDMRTAIRRSIIDNCVDTLVNLGYGNQVDGGRQRLSIYAEAADGKLSEAIDMIEEERTAYERYMPNV
jgi:RNA recognition motif-containing protein